MLLLKRFAIGLASGAALGAGAIFLQAGVTAARKPRERKETTLFLGAGILCTSAGVIAAATAILNDPD